MKTVIQLSGIPIISCFGYASAEPGGTLWTKTYGGSQNNRAYSTQQTNYGGYIIAGNTESYGAGAEDVYLLKLAEDRVCCDVEMQPDEYPVIVPRGGNFGLTGIVGNPTDDPITTDVWVYMKFSDSFLQLWRFPNFSLQDGQYLYAHLNQQVPVNT
ncbi:MAG: hypothetical protein GF315_01265 [candidate division Zixibacteria bacterium]|nr:hypothetical protein [candidate division Zixibacteria bacterium]